MRVLFASAEMAPVAAVGGLGQAATGLVAELRRQGVDVTVVLPDYGGVELADEMVSDVRVPGWAGRARLRSGTHPVVGELSLVDVPGMARGHPYLQPDGRGWEDNDHRFLAFSRAVAAIAGAAEPDVVHLNDWHTGAALAALDESARTVLSLHNLAYQGVTDGSWLRRIGPRAAPYEWYGGTNPLAGAIALADTIVAVSPTHADEIVTPDGGFGLDGPLRQRGDAVTGILNGIDMASWDPSKDEALVAHYPPTGRAFQRVTKRHVNRTAVRERVGFADDDTLLAVMVSRLTEQKGADLLVPIVPVLRTIPLRVVVLGAGEQAISAALRRAAAGHSDWFAFVEGYDEAFARLLFGAGDLYLMPSRFEPCGLAQMQAMRYGAVPVVTDVGGLHDTVTDADEVIDGRGFRAHEPSAVAFASTLFRAVRHLSSARQRNTLITRIMRLDWSWRDPARRYIELYERLVAGAPR